MKVGLQRPLVLSCQGRGRDLCPQAHTGGARRPMLTCVCCGQRQVHRWHEDRMTGALSPDTRPSPRPISHLITMQNLYLNLNAFAKKLQKRCARD